MNEIWFAHICYEFSHPYHQAVHMAPEDNQSLVAKAGYYIGGNAVIHEIDSA